MSSGHLLNKSALILYGMLVIWVESACHLLSGVRVRVGVDRQWECWWLVGVGVFSLERVQVKGHNCLF